MIHHTKLALAIAFVQLGCSPEPSDVRPTIEEASLSVEGERLIGTVAVRYESFGDVRMTVTDPELQLEAAGGSVRSLELVFPADFNGTFEPGDVRDVTFTIDDDSVWSSFCGSDVTVQVDHHSREEGGKVITSIGADVPIELPCN